MKFNYYVIVNDPVGLASLQVVKGFLADEEARRYLEEQKAWALERISHYQLQQVSTEDFRWLYLTREEALTSAEHRALVEEFEQEYELEGERKYDE